MSADNATAAKKAAIRRRLRGLRQGVPDAVRRRAGQIVRRLALSNRLLAKKRRFGFYVPAKGELDCMPMLDAALWLGADCYLPVVPRARQRKLWFTRLGERPHWAVNRYGIPEYGHRQSERVRASSLDVLFLPLLGFDAAGYRMGMGGGYYDSSLAFRTLRRRWRRPRLIGLAFEAQKVEKLPVEPWDVPLDGVITERAFYRFSSGGEVRLGP